MTLFPSIGQQSNNLTLAVKTYPYRSFLHVQLNVLKSPQFSKAPLCYAQAQKPFSSAPKNSSPDSLDEEANTAEELIVAQKAQQSKRRSREGTPRKRTKKSIWTTMASIPVDGDSTNLQCNVYIAILSSNSNVSSSKIKSQYESVN